MISKVWLLAAGLFAFGLNASEPVPDFRLPDVSPTSNRTGGMVSPRDYRLQISAWYFGHAG